ncbi:ABC transporter permease [Paracoccus versutus]
MKLNTKSLLLPLVALIISILGVGLIDPTFLRPAVLINLFADSATLFIMAIGLTFVIMTGSIDLSPQAVAALASVVLALLLPNLGGWAIPVALVVGVVAGAMSGFTYAVLRIPSFVATLAMGGIIASLTLYLSDQRAIQLDAALRSETLRWAIGRTFGLPNEIWLSLAVLIIALIVEQATPFGKAEKAVGFNEFGARANGIRVLRVKLIVFMIGGFFAALAGIVLAARLAAGSPTISNEFLLPAIAAVVLGGTALTGGAGGVLRTLLGVMLIAVFRTGMNFAGVNVLAQQIVFGLVLVLAVGLSIHRSPDNIVK